MSPRPTAGGHLCVTLAFTGLAPAIAAGTVSASETTTAQAMAALIGDGACDDDTQCRTIAVGAKACGGPEYYLAWSTKRTDATALREAAASELTARRNMRVDPRAQSNCMIVADPGAYCAQAVPHEGGTARTQSGVCRLHGANRRGSGPVD
jgi:hypothetical protein